MGAGGTPFVTRPTAPSMMAAKSVPPSALVAEIPFGPTPSVREPAPPPPVAPIAAVTSEVALGRSYTAPFGDPSAPPPSLPGSTRATPPPSVVAHNANASLEAGLNQLDLTQEQTQAILVLSREVIERIVWEVVPSLAETMIREEIRRLMREE